MKSKKKLLCFYSRDGHTKDITQIVSKQFGADVQEIEEYKNRAGILGWLGLGKDGTFKLNVDIKSINHDLGVYMDIPVKVATISGLKLPPCDI